MPTNIFVSLPIKDLKKSVKFFSELGFCFNPQFTDEHAICMIVSEDIYVMLMVEKSFVGFTKKTIPNTAQSIETIISISTNSRAEADRMVEKALKAGATHANDPMEMGYLYSRSFFDLDGHLWEIFFMDMDAVEMEDLAVETKVVETITSNHA